MTAWPVLVLVLGLALAGCGDNAVRVESARPLTIEAVEREVLVHSGQTRLISFRVTTTNDTPVPVQRVDFAAIDDPSTPDSDPAGATLSTTWSLTDAEGVATVKVAAGLTTQFILRGRTGTADAADVFVNVAKGDPASIAAVPTLVQGSTWAGQVAEVQVSAYDGLRCAQLSLTQPPHSVRMAQTVMLDQPADFGAVDSGTMTAVLAQGHGTNGRLLVAGCTDVPGSIVRSDTPVRIWVLLRDLVPTARGEFLLTSMFSLMKRPLVQQVAAPWRDLGDCPLDPAQVWLDCTVDSLGAPPGDEPDCVPSPGEGELADLIQARRGTQQTGSACRSALASTGTAGLDARLAALFPSPPKSPAKDLSALADEIVSLFDTITLSSTLSLQATASPSLLQATHGLNAVTFRLGGEVATVNVVAQGIPTSTVRFVSVTTISDPMRGYALQVQGHLLGLHIGTMARVAFGESSLAGRGLPATTPALLQALVGLASMGQAGATGATVSGCDALDALVCADVGRETGCVRAACMAGLDMLARKLDDAFVSADGDGADLSLSGSASLVDDDGDGVAEALGRAGTAPGLWTAEKSARVPAPKA